MPIISARQALTPHGWLDNVSIVIDKRGRIADINYGSGEADHPVGVLLPALSNVHSHSFQRAMAGLAERRGTNAFDDFWTWRNIMYRFLEILTPDDIGAIAAQVQMEMLEAGYAAQAEFHYVHHAPGGEPYEQIDETSLRHIDAARRTGIGYTHLPVLYMQGGLDGRPLQGGQLRFGCSIEGFHDLFRAVEKRFIDTPDDYQLGVAPHSLRAVSGDGFRASIAFAADGPVHIHAGEQVREIKEVQDALNAPPIEWILANAPVDNRWCFIHATHMTDSETDALARSGAVAGLCPITEANLGDGIFNGARYCRQEGAIGIGSDSNVKIALGEELRVLETTQRLRHHRRVVLADETTPSNGRYLYEKAAKGGAQALGRDSGRLEVGALADLIALDDDDIAIAGLRKDTILDTWIFTGADKLVKDVWSAGRHVVSGGRHKRREDITSKYRSTIKRLRAAI